jgi:hypothetical protein
MEKLNQHHHTLINRIWVEDSQSYISEEYAAINSPEFCMSLKLGSREKEWENSKEEWIETSIISYISLLHVESLVHGVFLVCC